MTTITKPGIYQMTNAEYHAHDALSASRMKTLLEAPAKFKHERENPVHKNLFDFGSAWHKAVLGDEGEELVVVQADSWRTNVAKEQKEKAHAENKIPLLEKDKDLIDEMVAVLRAHPEASALLDPAKGQIEQSAFWQDARTGLWLRVRFDYLPDKVPGLPFMIADPKSAASSKPEKWLKSAADLGYHIQDSLYRQAVRELGIDPRPAFTFICQEKDPPYIVTPIRLDGEAQKIGDYLVRVAIDTYIQCEATGEWPGYIEGVAIGRLPGYYTNQFEGLI